MDFIVFYKIFYLLILFIILLLSNVFGMIIVDLKLGIINWRFKINVFFWIVYKFFLEKGYIF